MKKLAEIFASIALMAAKSAAGAASEWCTYQPKEPDALHEFMK